MRGTRPRSLGRRTGGGPGFWNCFPPPVIIARVGQPAPDFEAAAFVDGGFKNIKLSDYRGKWVVLCFYPGDFTFAWQVIFTSYPPPGVQDFLLPREFFRAYPPRSQAPIWNPRSSDHRIISRSGAIICRSLPRINLRKGGFSVHK